jgi:DNA helicase HerA-like ATPase
MKNENTAIFLSNLARRGAKYNTSLIVASQSFREFASEEGQVLLNQCDTKYFLKMQPSEAREMGKYI